ncbi:LuxR C-terminal-related transcriptional regulator [Microbulbifer elongatus]|uniref:LuxR C-terminal-related transcriptional regulator n=1 Tax=Microbulbifer elongatus TaxID=86173 RepID=UPI001E36DB35|nr:LuxR C-terminal-related transcriptional regulator [Microbulbifer elongatus]
MDLERLAANSNPIYRAWHNIPGFFARKGVAQQRYELDQFIANTFSSGPCYYYVLDFLNLDKPMMVSPSIQDILGVDPQAATVQSLIERGHPEDVPFAAKAEETAFFILKNHIGMDQAKNYKISYSGRMRVADGSYRLFNHQAIILDTDEHYGVARTLGIHTDITHLVSASNYKLSLLNLFGGESYSNIDVFNNPQQCIGTPSLFTQREMEIVRLLADGKTSADVARLLNISPHTVKNHRKNILKKSDCKTTGQLVSRCISEGLI